MNKRGFLSPKHSKAPPDYAGKVFHDLTVLRRSEGAEVVKMKSGHAQWLCRCSCGNLTSVASRNLKDGWTKNCGCKSRYDYANPRMTHGMSRNRKNGMRATIEYNLWLTARARAKKYGLAFDLELADIVLPPVCPILKTPFTRGEGRATPTSATLDRLDNNKGYTKDNVNIISYRANLIKNDASLADLEALVSWMKTRLNNP